jgi:hypothetical protein
MFEEKKNTTRQIEAITNIFCIDFHKYFISFQAQEPINPCKLTIMYKKQYFFVNSCFFILHNPFLFVFQTEKDPSFLKMMYQSFKANIYILRKKRKKDILHGF